MRDSRLSFTLSSFFEWFGGEICENIQKSYEVGRKFRNTFKSKALQFHANADGLSRLPLENCSMEGLSIEPSIYNISHIDFLPITVAKVKNATSTDPILSKVLSFILDGLWTETVTEEMKPFQQRSTELTSENGTILWGIRVVIPERLQSYMNYTVTTQELAE